MDEEDRFEPQQRRRRDKKSKDVEEEDSERSSGRDDEPTTLHKTKLTPTEQMGLEEAVMGLVGVFGRSSSKNSL